MFGHATRGTGQRAGKGLHGAWLLFVLAATYLAFAYVLTPNRPFPYYPDDFSFLAGTLGDMGWNWKRPVSSNIIFLVAACGHVASYAVVAASAVVVAWLALLLLRDVFALEVGLLPAIACGVMLFSHAAAFEHGKYLGLLTNLVSHGFGLASLWLLWRGWRGGRGAYCILSLLAYLASALAKEDFLLPPLLLAALLWSGGGGLPRRGRIVMSLMLLLVAAGSLAWNAYDRNPFVAGLFSPETSSGSYAVALAPQALLAAFGKLFVGYTGVATVVTACVGLVLWRVPGMRLRVLWFAATVVSLALPYAVIPNNMPGYRAYAWLPWMAGFLAIGLAYWRNAGARVPGPHRVAWMLVAVLVPAAVALAQHDARIELAQRYAGGEAVNRRMLDLLEAHRGGLDGAAVVGLHGLDGPSPWCGNGTLYLHRKRGFEQRWLVFAPGSTPCYHDPSASPRKPRYDLRLSVAPPASACTMGDLPVLSFEPDGRGRLASARELCIAAGGTPDP